MANSSSLQFLGAVMEHCTSAGAPLLAGDATLAECRSG